MTLASNCERGGLATSAPEKLARLFLEWYAEGEETKFGTRITLPVTDEEIGESFGRSREAVTLTPGEFWESPVPLKGSSATIPN